MKLSLYNEINNNTKAVPKLRGYIEMNIASVKPSIFILIRSLNVGGAERQVSVLARALKDRDYKVAVGVFYSGGSFEEALRQIGVSVYSLEKKGRWDLIGWFFRYLRVIKEVNPDVIYSFMTVSNIIAVIGKLFVPKPVVWGIRASNIHFENYDWVSRFTSWIENKLSRYATSIIFNSLYSRQFHESIGYCVQNVVVIPNGIDTETFKPDKAVRDGLRDRLKIPRDAIVIGMVARFDPMKDYETYLSAVRVLAPHHPKMYFIAAGVGTDSAEWTSLPSHFLSLGYWEDIPGLLNVLDIMVLSSSFGEGFSNVIGEAMACGIPVVATDVGDASYIISDQGLIVPAKNPEALIQAIRLILQTPLSSERIRGRIVQNFSIPQMVDRTIKTLTDTCKLS